MHGTSSNIPKTYEERVAALSQASPGWDRWLELLSVVRTALGEPGFVAGFESEEAPGSSPGANDAPLLDGLRISVDAERLRDLFGRLLQAIDEEKAEKDSPDTRSLPLELVAASIRNDSDAMRELAGSLGLEGERLEAVSGFLAIPVLSEEASRLASAIPNVWRHGYCPVCGAWPALAEFRGLDRARLLRCGRCGCGWPINWLRCVYCGEDDHDRLGSLVPEEGGEQLRVETCESCRGYLKGVTTLQERPIPELLLRDLETVELDLVALDRGYARPQRPGHGVDVRVVADPSRASDHEG